jgi:hypothetical protein
VTHRLAFLFETLDAAAPAPAQTACGALDLLPPDLWTHALEQLDEKRDVVHAAACCRWAEEGGMRRGEERAIEGAACVAPGVSVACPASVTGKSLALIS